MVMDAPDESKEESQIQDFLDRCLDEDAPAPDRDMIPEGPHQNEMETLLQAHEQDGESGARDVWNRFVKKGTELVDVYAPNEGTGWNLTSLTEAYEHDPTRKYLVEGLIAKGSLDILFGFPGSMKTMLALDMGLSVASGKPWLPAGPTTKGRTFPTNQSSVLFIDQDSGKTELYQRMQAIVDAKGIDQQETPFQCITMPDPLMNAQNSESINRLTKHIEANNIEMVFLDNLGSISGDADENSSQMTNVMSQFRKVADHMNCAVIILHHQRKEAAKNRKGNALRGHTSIEAALDLAILAKKGAFGHVFLETTKARFLPETKFSARFSYEHQDHTRELKTAMFHRFHQDVDPRLIRAQEIVMKEMEEGANKGDLVSLVRQNSDIGKPAARNAIEELVEDGSLKKDSSQGGYSFYRG